MKPNEILFADADGNINAVSHKDYVNKLIAEFDIKEGKNEETGAVYPANKIANHIVTSVRDGMGAELPDFFTTNYQKVIDRVTEDYTAAKKLDEKLSASKKKEKEKDAEEKKKEAEEKKAAKEAADKERAELQSFFADEYMKGAAAAKEDLVRDLTALKEGLPEGFSLKFEGNSVGLLVAEGVDKTQLGYALGFLSSKQESSEFISNQFSFIIGDLANAAVKEGVYTSMIEAGKSLSSELQKRGKIFSGKGIEGYARMAARIPMDKRNPYVSPSAYLAVANLPNLKKKEGEGDEDFKKRVETYETAKSSLVDKMYEGELVDHKTTKEEITKIQTGLGLKEPVTPSTPSLSVRDHLGNLFHSRFALDHLIGVKKPGVAHFEDGGNIVEVTQEDLQAKYEQSYAALQNILYTGSDREGKTTPEEYLKGFKMVKKLVPGDVDKETGKAVSTEQEFKIDVVPKLQIVAEVKPASEEKEEEAPKKEAKPAAKKTAAKAGK